MIREIAGVFAIMAAVFIAGYYIGGADYEASAKLEALNEYKVRIDAAENKSRELEEKLKASNASKMKLRRDLQNEIANNNAYDDCVMPSDGVRILNEAIDSSATNSVN